MSGPATRRRAAWLAGAAALMPALLSTLPPSPAEATAPRQFRPPSEAMVLIRTLRRPLGDGTVIETRRSYEIHFMPVADGYRVDGRLIEVDVDAPPHLQALALLERQRPDEGMFPMRLDHRGLFLPIEPTVQAEEVRMAGIRVRKQVEALSLDPFDRSTASAFARSFEQQSVRTAWPEDLFSPAPGEREETRTIPLPNGARGTVRIMVNASTHSASGLLGSFVRRVSTDLDGSHRITEESWTLAAKG